MKEPTPQKSSPRSSTIPLYITSHDVIGAASGLLKEVVTVVVVEELTRLFSGEAAVPDEVGVDEGTGRVSRPVLAVRADAQNHHVKAVWKSGILL